MMDQFAAYSHAIASLAFWAFLVSILAGLSGAGRTADNRCECGKPKRDYANPVYRRERAFMNAVETSGPFVAALVAAILAGAAPIWVNTAASVFVVARLATAFIHIRTENQPLRSLTWFIGFLCILVLIVMTLGAVFWG